MLLYITERAILTWLQHDYSAIWRLQSTLKSRGVQQILNACTVFSVHACAKCRLLCIDLSECKFWPFAELKSQCPYICMYINEYEQDYLVSDKVSVSCSLVWQSSPGLLLSTPISLQNTAPSPRGRHSLTLETSTLGSLIFRDMRCLLPHSISIAA